MKCSLSPAELKVCLLSQGISFDLDLFADIKRDFYENQYVYNQTSRGLKREHRLPQVLCLESKVITAILRRDNTPWNLRVNNDEVELYNREDLVSVLGLPKRPPYFGKIMSDGTSSENIIAVAGEQIPGFFLYPNCLYFDQGNPCKFCSVRGTRKTVGKSMVSEFSEEQLKEATRLFQNIPWIDIPVLSITTGTFPDGDEGALYTSRMVKAIYDALEPKIPIHLLTIPPDNIDLIAKYKEAGVTTLAFNIEVYNPDVFKELCPGKEKFYGYKKFVHVFDIARDIFGDYNIFCGFVWGLEPNKSTLRGYEHFLDRGVSISSNVFHADSRSLLRNKPHPSVKTILEMCVEQGKLYERYPNARTIFPVSMRSTLDYEIYRGDFR